MLQQSSRLPTSPADPRPFRLWRWTAKGAWIGAVVMVPTACAGLSSTGGGHGDYTFFSILFPFTHFLAFGAQAPPGTWQSTLAAFLQIPPPGQGNAYPAFSLVFLQFPLYGALLGHAAARGRLWLAGALALLTSLHTLAVLAASACAT